MPPSKTAIWPTREENFAEWYQNVIREADLAENSPVRGCMVIKPWGYAIWEYIQRDLDRRIRARGVQNAYFPLLIPLHFLEKEAEHVEGFAKECAVVTCHRLEKRGDRLVPSSPLEEPLVIRPTSETMIGHCFAKWIDSHRDLPFKINQWANVMRWEMRPRLFLRSTEILWQEGHTVHATAKEAREEASSMLCLYAEMASSLLALPTLMGTKSAFERFPGAEETHTLEMMMQDGKALQAGTSHYLGQRFARGCGIQFTNVKGEREYGHMTSWGVTTRLIGALIMVHGDDDGLRLPPQIAPHQVVLIPFLLKESDVVLRYAEEVIRELQPLSFASAPLRLFLDQREALRAGEKKWQWIKKGVPIRLEVGLREKDEGTVTYSRRDWPAHRKESLPLNCFVEQLPILLQEIENNYRQEAEERLHTHIHDIDQWEKAPSLSAETNGWLCSFWCGNQNCEQKMHSHSLTLRCLLPKEEENQQGKCLICRSHAIQRVIWANSY